MSNEGNKHFLMGLLCGIALMMILYVLLHNINTSELPQAWVDREELVIQYEGQPYKLVPVELEKSWNRKDAE